MYPPTQPVSPWRTHARRAFAPLRWLLGWLLALLILFEEWGWEPLLRLVARLARWPWIARLEARVAALHPYLALLAFAAPTVMLLPVKLAALWLIGHGHAVGGLAVIVVAKIAGTAVVARLFSLTRPRLMQLGWFARLYARWSELKERLIAMARASAAWRAARAMKARGRRLVRAVLRAFNPSGPPG